MNDAFFCFFCFVAVLSALGVIFSPQGVQSALWMAAALLGISGVMASMGAWLVGLLTFLVYAGAILMLFVFVVMFTGQQRSGKKIGRWRFLFALASIVGGVLLLYPAFGQAVQQNFFGAQNSLCCSTAYGAELFGRYFLAVELMAWLLLWVAVGALHLSSPAKKEGVA